MNRRLFQLIGDAPPNKEFLITVSYLEVGMVSPVEFVFPFLCFVEDNKAIMIAIFVVSGTHTQLLVSYLG